MARLAALRKSIGALLVTLFGVGLGYEGISYLIQEIRYLRDGRPATAQTVTYHSRFRTATRYDVVYEREGQQVHARMYLPAFSWAEAGVEILYLPDRPDKVELNSRWNHFCGLAGCSVVIVCALVAVLVGLNSLFGGGRTDEKDGASAPGAPAGTDKGQVND